MFVPGSRSRVHREDPVSTVPSDRPSSGPRSVELSVVIPAHNSAAVIESTVNAFADYLGNRDAEIIVVENGSTDETAHVCDKLLNGWSGPVRLIVIASTKGMGNALRTGIARSVGARVLLTADDLPFGFDDLDGAYRHTGGLPPVAIGSKAHSASVVQRGLARSVLTRGFTALRRIVLGTRTKDPQGTFLVDGLLLRALAPALTEPGFLFTTELDYAVELAGLRPLELPVRLSASHRDQPSRVAGSDIVAMGRGLLALRSRRAELLEAATSAGAGARPTN
ncbi:glycosyltransferase [Rhodococcus sp. BP-107]|uniref:glycosyltransferase n=1 Tax=unclassified Rhodococcus (in: high G+C Gram-positive bacteria) TaxID=192944 RepID=UPI0035AB8722